MSIITMRAPVSPPRATPGASTAGKSDATEWPQLAGLLVDEGIRSERKHVHHPEHPLGARVVVPQVDVEVEGDALGSDEVVRLVAGRTRSDLEKDEQIDRERNGERNQSRDQAPERDAVESRQERLQLELSLAAARRSSPRRPNPSLMP